MEEVCHISETNSTDTSRFSRGEKAAKVISFENARKKAELSERKASEQVGVPRSTLRDWVSRKASINAPQAQVEFFESPEGLAFLHRLVLAAQLVITLVAPGSIRHVCTFLVLAGLNQFVASSYGSQQKAILDMERQLAVFGLLEFRRLCEMMLPKKITILEDETFHPQICLVAIEAASGFILLELYVENRNSETWTKELKKAVGNLPVEIVQATSDEAKALLKHHEKDLQVSHSPDVFHVQHDLFKGTSLSMARDVKKAQTSVEEAEKFTERLVESAKIYEEFEEDKRHCSPEWVRQNIEQAKAAEKVEQAKLKQAEVQQESMAQEIRDISNSYHPFDLKTGTARSAEQVNTDLSGHFERIDEIAEKAELSQSCLDRIDKARRVLPLMVATISFFHDTINRWVGELCLTEKIERFLMERWIPGRYLELVASRVRDPEQRVRLLEAAANLIPSADQITSMLSLLCDNDRLLVAAMVEQCAQLFQRSSSGVEGRNGQLSLFHHGHHRLPENKLKALTVIHNYMKVRPDGTTAAERLFGHQPLDIFEWLVERMEYPARPSKSRKKIAA